MQDNISFKGAVAVSHQPDPKGIERILLVDDETEIVEMAHLMLEMLGYHVTSRSSSIEALEAFKNQPDNFELVITDLTMPHMTGLQIAREMRDIRADIPIILCTGLLDHTIHNKVQSVGINKLLMKPVIKSELAKSIREVLDVN